MEKIKGFRLDSGLLYIGDVMNKEQIKNRIRHKMQDYVYANRGPFSKPRQIKLIGKQIAVPLSEVDNELSVMDKGKAVLSLHIIKQVLSEQEQEILSYRLMGYKIEEIARMLMQAPQTIRNKLVHITKVCKEVNNV